MAGFLSLDELFEGRHFDREIIVLCVRWYLRFKLSFRDLVEMMAERNLSIATPPSCAGCIVMRRSSSVAGTDSHGRLGRRGASMNLREDPRPVGVFVSSGGPRGKDRGLSPEDQARCCRGQGIPP